MKALQRAAIALVVAVAVIGVAVVAWELTPGPAGDGRGQSRGEAAIGGPFELTNTEGETVTAADFRGDYMLVYFGYTYCPDVCPTSLMDLTRALDRLAQQAPETAQRIQPVFITVDPQRDTVAVMDNYVENFHPRLVGLTGREEQVRAAARAYRVHYEKVTPAEYYGTDSEAAQAADPDTEYLISHASHIYLMGPEGDYITNFKYGERPADIAEGLRRHVEG
jgi:protein SCO1/2